MIQRYKMVELQNGTQSRNGVCYKMVRYKMVRYKMVRYKMVQLQNSTLRDDMQTL